MKDFMALYGGLVERCFTSCCNDFTTKALTGKEVSNKRPSLPCSAHGLNRNTLFSAGGVCKNVHRQVFGAL
jgi:hypothetical protein